MASPVPANSPLLNPNQALSGQSLLTAAQGLVNAQTAGPLAELAKQIAANNSQSQAAVNQAGGFYNQLGQQAQSGANQVNAIGTGLNTQLGQIASDTQGQLGQIGQNASASLLKYAPQSDASNSLAQPAMQSLTQELARQQGLAAQSQGAFRAFGANQGANYGGLAASNLGTFALKGQEGLRGIAQAGQLKNEPLMSKVANIRASRGADLTTAIGRLRQAEVNNSIAQAGLGIKSQANQISQNNNIRTNQTSASNNANTVNATLKGQQLTQMNNDRRFKLDQQKYGNDVAKDNYLRAHGLGPYKPANGSGNGPKPFSPATNARYQSVLDRTMSMINLAHTKGVTNPNQIRADLPQAMGRDYNSTLAEAAMEILGYGSITASTAAALHNLGMRNTSINGKPLKVTANYSPTNPAMNPPSLAGRVGGAVKSLGNIFG